MEGSSLKTLIQKKVYGVQSQGYNQGKLTEAIEGVFMTRCFTDMCDVYIMGTFTFDTRQQKIVPKKPRLTMVKMW